MNVTLEQARVFESVARVGTVQKAADELGRRHSSILYAIKTLEEQTGIALFDRSGHRNKVTLQGELILKHCRTLLNAHQGLESACVKIKGGWDPSLKLIYDEAVDFDFIASSIARIRKISSPTEIKILSAHLHEVEELFKQENADMMVTILPLQELQIPSRKLRPIQMMLVAHRAHPICKASKNAKLSTEELNKHTFVAIKTPAHPVGLSTEKMQFDSYFYLNGFMAKKVAILRKLGFGWLPDYMIETELQSGVIQVLKSEVENVHTLYPRLYHRPEDTLGPTAIQFLKSLSQSS